MSQTSPKLRPAARESLQIVADYAQQLQPKRESGVVRRFEALPGVSIGTFDAGELAVYGILAANRASVAGPAANISRMIGLWITPREGWEAGQVSRIDVRRMALLPPRSPFTETMVTLLSPSFTDGDGRIGLDVSVRSHAGEPYEGWLSVVRTHTHRDGDPAIVDEVYPTTLGTDASPASPYAGLQEAERAAVVAAMLPLMAGAGVLLEAVAQGSVPDITATRLRLPPS